jgi:integrase
MTTALITPSEAAAPDLAGLANLSAVSPEAALRRPLAELVAATLDAAGSSEHTRRAYQTAIGLFLEYLDHARGELLPPALAAQWRPLAAASQEGRKTVWTIRGAAAVLRLVDAGLLDSFRAARVAAGDETETASLRVNAVRTFLRVALRDGALTQEQAAALGLKPYRARLRRDRQPEGRRLTKEEARALRAAVLTATAKGKRDLAILDVMLFAGLRRDEVAALDLASFRQDGGRWWIVFSGKGQKTRRVKVADPLYRSLTAWLEAAGLVLGLGAGPLFRSVNRGDGVSARPVNAAVIGRLVAEYGAAAGLAPLAGQNRLSAHDLRRTCARIAYDNGAPLLLVQAMLGHSDPSTTARYIGAYTDDAQTAVDFVRY